MKKLLILALVLCSYFLAEEKIAIDYLLVQKGAIAPEFSLYDSIKRKKYSVGENREKKLLLINFFATYCKPCKQEFPGFSKLYEKYGKSLQILAISVEKDNKKISDFAKELNLNFPVFMDYTKASINQYIKPASTAALPTNILVGKDGVILEITTTLEEKTLEEWVIKYSGLKEQLKDQSKEK